jgi:hypothetical protein
LEQTSEIHYGQRKGYDVGGILINTGAGLAGSAVGGYVGGKLGKGVLSLAGESAPALSRGVASVTGVVAGGRAGAATTNLIEGVANRITGRSDASASEIFGAAGGELVDLKGGALDLVGGGLGHAVHSSARPSSSWLGRKLLVQPPSNRVPAAAPPPSAAEVGKTSAPAGAADIASARVPPPPTTETQTRPAADVPSAASSAGKTRPTSRSTATRLGIRVLEAVIRGRLQADPSIRGIPGGDFKPTPALVEGRSPKEGVTSPTKTSDPAAGSDTPTSTKSDAPARV